MFEGTPFAGMDEKQIIRDRVAELYLLPALIEEAIAEVRLEMDREPYTPWQKHLTQSQRVNMLVSLKWESIQDDSSWKLVDPAYMHLEDTVTGLQVELHPASRGVSGVVKPANTQTARAKFRQQACRGADELDARMGDDGVLVPDLSGVCGQLIWRLVGHEIEVRFFKPLDGEKRKSAYDCPILRDRVTMKEMQFEHDQTEDFEIDGLIADMKADREKELSEGTSSDETSDAKVSSDGDIDGNDEDSNENQNNRQDGKDDVE